MNKSKRLALWACIALMVIGVSILRAGTTSKTKGGSQGYPANAKGKVYLLERTLDFSSSSDTGTAAEIYQLITVPAGTWVSHVGYQLITNRNNYAGSSNATCTIDIGDGSDADGYIDGANVITGQTLYADSGLVAYTLTNLLEHGTMATITVGRASGAYGMGKIYTASDTIDMTLNNAEAELKIRFTALCHPIGEGEL